jgi:hypothetical protein
MAPKTPDASESLTGFAKQTAEQITERTQEATAKYFSWLQDAMSASPWVNTELNKKLLSYATETVTDGSAFMQQLSQAKNFEDVVKIQTEFVKTQMDSFHRRAKELGEICTKMATAATKTPLSMST